MQRQLGEEVLEDGIVGVLIEGATDPASLEVGWK